MMSLLSMNLTTQKVITLMRLALGFIFLWYGVLKLFPDLSPAEKLATMTIEKLFFGLIPNDVSIKLLAILEIIVGMGFLFKVYTRIVVVVFLVHITFTFTALFLLSDICFTQAPYAFTIVGQYIVKNIVFILAGLLIYINEK